MSFAHLRRGAALALLALTASTALAAGEPQSPEARTPPDAGTPPDAADARAAQCAGPDGCIAMIALGRRSAHRGSQQAQTNSANAQPNGRGAEIRPYHAPHGQ